MRRSSIAFVVAFLILVWFGAEAFTGGNICVTSCISLAGMNSIEMAIAVAILPAIIVAWGVNERKNEARIQAKGTAATPADGAGRDDVTKE